jgi:hypothetical protein
MQVRLRIVMKHNVQTEDVYSVREMTNKYTSSSAVVAIT